jgi:hypothetical protein
MIDEYKGYKIESDGTFGMKRIRSIGKGSLPQMLKGHFSNTGMARRSIDVYLAQKGNKNGEEITAG